MQERVAEVLIFKSREVSTLEPLVAEVAAALYAPDGPFGDDFRQAHQAAAK